jgi:thiosulfate/3-mercaptopyruvate sulfurtransferase|tara:strand:+ start:6939 stop:7736 length:798 start_codon:yes stop_codon:yes gene_type:complete
MLAPIVEPEELQSELSNSRLLLVDLCQEETYSRSHLPGAIHVSPRELIGGVKPATGKLPDRQRLSDLFSRIGLRSDQHLVAYDDEGGGWAGRFLWTLDVIGHAAHSYLNGGLIAWTEEKRPLESQPNQPTAAMVSVSINRQPIVDKEYLLSHLDDPGVVIWDARSASEFNGSKVQAARGGHIPGAVNLDWLDTMDRNRGLRIRSDIEKILIDHGISRDKEVITHCQTHHRSSLTYLIGKSLGYRIKAYDGSWSEWGNDPHTPIDV